MNKQLLLIVLSLSFLVSQNTLGQINLTWDDFADVSYKSEYNAAYGVSFLVPTFGKKIQEYDGKKISIMGYFLDLAGDGEMLLVSQNPMATCFFCGTAGPETVIEVQFQKRPPFRTDQIVTITGTLELNSIDVEHCNYILKDATGKRLN